MQTMHPVIVSGHHFLDTDLFPLDEFALRLEGVRALARAQGWSGIVIYGNGEDASLLTYLTNFAPRMRWVLGFVPIEGDVELVVAGPTRELSLVAPLTWVQRIYSYDELGQVMGRWSSEQRSKAHGGTLRLGLFGADAIRPKVLADLVAAAGAASLEDADAVFDALLERKRPREVRALKRNCVLLEQLIQIVREARLAGSSAAESVRAAEKRGIQIGAHEVRTLFSIDGGKTLQPFERLTAEAEGPLIAYLAVRVLGYWTESLITIGGEKAITDAVSKALSAVVAAAAPGVGESELRAASAKYASAYRQHPFTLRGISHLGLVMREMPAEDILKEGGVYSLRIGLSSESDRHAIASAVVHVRQDGVDVLHDSRKLGLAPQEPSL